MRAFVIISLAAAALTVGCANSGKVSIPTADALSVVGKAATCVAAVNAAATDPVCRAPIQPCTDAYNAGRAAVQNAQ